MSVPQPFPYQGSKRRLAKAILGYMPDGIARLIEPFAGSAAISLAALALRKAPHVVIADSDQPLMAMWQAILHTPEALAEGYRALWQAQLGQERAFYERVRAAFNRERCPEQLLYLLSRCVKASVRYNERGEFNQSADHRRKGAKPQTVRKRLMDAHTLLKGRATLLCADYRETLQLATPHDVIYLDPPYAGVTQRDKRYRAQLDRAALFEALDALNKRQIPYLLSYDGRTGAKTYGAPLPEHLGLLRLELYAGRSSQATLNGKHAFTYEALYLSPALQERSGLTTLQLELFAT
ncbi:MAG: Dam family site-specific DNA-(adenine-N6)-methyltransferase [Anaerolineae bacterium]|nr:Dam family site-specific DNA-(adenine-N6)-methyltransferase [Anaerolineae bacterium]